MEHHRRHRFIFKLLYWPARLWSRILLNYRPKTASIPTPSLILSNHCTDLDPVLLGVTVKKHTYFVASEHIFHTKGGRFVLWAQAPIARMKGTTAADTALAAIRRLKKGYNVTIFPEGNRTFNGRTAAVIRSTAKLARVSGASLVTHRFRGGYLSSPRWAGSSIRRGLLTGEIVRIYTPAELKAMTVDEIADIIAADLYEDAYATQAQWRIPYKGKNLARHLERALYLCPRCRRFGTLRSAGDTLSCTGCGLAARYTPLGYLEGSDLPFSTVTDWDIWQAGLMPGLIHAAGQDALFSDDDVTVTELTEDYDEHPFASGTLSGYADRFRCGDEDFPFDQITGVGLPGPQGMTLTVRGHHLSFSSEKIMSMRKYMTLYHAVTAPDEILSI